MFLLASALLLGCPGSSDQKGDDSVPTSAQDDTGDTQPTGDCIDDNEECGPGSCNGEGADMLPGSDCQACHSSGTGSDAPRWTVAGTVFSDILGTDGVRNAVVHVTDADGKHLDLQTHSSGNFYTTDRVTLPLTVEVEKNGETRTMGTAATSGACNSCHQCGGEAGGKLYQ